MFINKNFSKNKKLNAALNNIYYDLEQLGGDEVLHYISEFKREPDYNIAQYGNMLIYFDDVRKMYDKCGYKSLNTYSDGKIWDLYLCQVGYVARMVYLYKAI